MLEDIRKVYIIREFARVLREEEKLSTKVHGILRNLIITSTDGFLDDMLPIAAELVKWIRKERIRISYDTYLLLVEVDEILGNSGE